MDSILHAYATLGLKRGCSLLEVKKRYRSLVKRWHPDRFASDPTGAGQAAEELQAGDSQLISVVTTSQG